MMSGESGDGKPINAGDLQWTSDPIAFGEAVDLLQFDEEALLPYAREQQRDLHWVRQLLHESLACVSRLTAALARCQAQIAVLIHELRLAREESAALRARLRGLREDR